MNKNTKSTAPLPVKIITYGAILITLFFHTKLQDPFNVAKLAILILITVGLLPYISKNLIKSNIIGIKLLLILSSLIVGLIIAALFTDVKYVAFFGESQRKLGLLTYLCLTVILLSSYIYFNIESTKYIYKAVYFLGSLLSLYAIIQATGKDFVKWNNPYNSIIGTLGNPNFTSAFFAILAVLIFARIFLNQGLMFRITNSILVLVLLLLIIKSNSRQGLVAFFIGATFILCILLNNKNKVIGKFAIFTALGLLMLTILGMLQIGPFASYVYKASVSIRGYYWRAGIDMFLSNPVSGIGLDRYGAYFKEFRSVEYPLNYGYQITSTNAHNVFIQMFATGGLLVGVPFIALTLFIAYNGFKSIKKFTGNDQIIFLGIYGAWLAFEAQSVISIDNIGLTIWGWILGGTILALSKTITVNNMDNKRKQNFNKQDFKPIISSLLIIVFGIFDLLLVKGDSNMWQARAVYDSNIQSKNEVFKKFAEQTISTSLVDPFYKVLCVDYLASFGYLDDASKLAANLVDYDKRNLDYLSTAARIYEGKKEIANAINMRLRIVKYDQWNADNYLQLLKDYKLVGNIEGANLTKSKIYSFAANSEQAKNATLELATELK